MSNVINSRVILDIALWFCLWPPEKPKAYQAGNQLTGTTHKMYGI